MPLLNRPLHLGLLKRRTSWFEIANALKLGIPKAEEDFLVESVGPLSHNRVGMLSFSHTPLVAPPQGLVFVPNSQAQDSGLIAGMISSEVPRLDFIRVLDWIDRNIGFQDTFADSLIHSTAVIAKSATIHDKVSIGANTIIHEGVSIWPGTCIGANCEILPNAVIGNAGFGYERLADGTPVKFIHFAGVTIDDNVEIGALTSISRGVFYDTWLQPHVKVDALVHIAHNCIVEKGAFVIAMSELNGGVHVGEGAWIGPNSTVLNNVKIGHGAKVGIASVALKDVAPNSTVFGNPARQVPT
jgi:acetyltransferase-like isoleucine patch superfamily enzyme